MGVLCPARPTAADRADRADRFIAGLSSGGHGAMKYAAINPQLFGAAGEFSGAVDTTISYPVYPAVSEALWATTLYYRPVGNCTWGDFVTQQVIWKDNNPTYLATNLRGVALYLTSGNGNQGEYDANPTFNPTEWTVNQMNITTSARRPPTAGRPRTCGLRRARVTPCCQSLGSRHRHQLRLFPGTPPEARGLGRATTTGHYGHE